MADGAVEFNAAGILPRGYELRSATWQDGFAMADVLVAASNARTDFSIPYVFTPDLARRTVMDAMVMPLSWAHVVEGPDELAGFAIGFPSTETEYAKSDPDAEYLSLLMVQPRDWGRGVARALLAAAAHTARNRGKERISLWTAESNVRARRLYELNNYNLTGLHKVSLLQGLLLEYMVDLNLT